MNLISCYRPIKPNALFRFRLNGRGRSDEIRFYNEQIKYNQRDFLDSYPMMMLAIKR